jgi:hypothetical protein
LAISTTQSRLHPYFAPGLDIRREIARVHIGDRRHKGGAREGQVAIPAEAPALKHLTGRRDSALGQRGLSRASRRAAEKRPGAIADEVWMRRIEKDHLRRIPG